MHSLGLYSALGISDGSLRRCWLISNIVPEAFAGRKNPGPAAYWDEPCPVEPMRGNVAMPMTSTEFISGHATNWRLDP